ncbi:MAG: hypothetical protein EBZ77_13485, partial [Chitinophagia bacterium]|nr:hypothetical protein [Chitinophagia bacterium]
SDVYKRQEIPALVRTFLVRGLVFFVLWQALYHLVLMPTRFPDKQLTDATSFSVQQVLSVFYAQTGLIYSDRIKKRQDILIINHKKIVAIGDYCNGLEIYVLYLAFIACFPGAIRQKIIFSLIGIPYIYIINCTRILLISLLNMYKRDWVDISHHYIFTVVVYFLVFYLWQRYTRTLKYVEK